MNSKNPAVRILIALIMGLAISLVTLKLTTVFSLSEESFFPSSFVTHTFMWAISIGIILILSKGEINNYGFTKGNFRLTPKIFLWVIPTGLISVFGFIASRSRGEVQEVVELSKLQDIIFVWIYASISEEIFTRGLLLSFLSPLRTYRISLFNRWRLSAPVLFSGFYFGGMHIVLIHKLGPAVLFILILTSLLGIVAGYYREKTESLIPAIIIHALFNIGGMLPIWLLSWIF